MKSEGAIRQKLKQARFRHLKKILQADLSTLPINCEHNRILDLPDIEVSICSLYATVCDEQYGGREIARECPKYQGRYEKEKLKEDFLLLMTESSIGTIAVEYPDIAALMWVLEDDDEIDLEGFEETEEMIPEEEEEEMVWDDYPRTTWFRRFLRRLFRRE